MKPLSIKRLLILIALVLLPLSTKAQTNTFCASNLTCTVNGAWSLPNIPAITLNGTGSFAPIASTIAASPTGATESGTTVTITTIATCTFTTGQWVNISGVGGATANSYNGNWKVLTPGCNGGSTFTFTAFASGLAASGGGTVTPTFLFNAGSQVQTNPAYDTFNPSTWNASNGTALFMHEMDTGATNCRAEIARTQSLSTFAEFQGFCSAVQVPASNNLGGAVAIGGYISDNGPLASGEIVGGQLQGSCLVSGCVSWGGNLISGYDASGLTNTGMQGVEVDTQPNNVPGAYTKGLNGIQDNLFATQAGSFGNALSINSSQVGVWGVGVFINTAALGTSGNNPALMVNPSGTATGANNFPAPKLTRYLESYWTGAAAANAEWDLAGSIGSGANPSSSLILSHSGNSNGAGLFIQAPFAGSNWTSVTGPILFTITNTDASAGNAVAQYFGHSGDNFSNFIASVITGASGNQKSDLVFGGRNADNGTPAENVRFPAGGGIKTGGVLLISGTAPTIAAAGCGGAAASIVVSNGTAAFKVNVGTTPTSACTLTFPAATTGWNVNCNDITTQSTAVFVQKQTGVESTTSVTITNFNDVAVATAFVASDILKCTAAAD